MKHRNSEPENPAKLDLYHERWNAVIQNSSRKPDEIRIISWKNQNSSRKLGHIKISSFKNLHFQITSSKRKSLPNPYKNIIFFQNELELEFVWEITYKTHKFRQQFLCETGPWFELNQTHHHITTLLTVWSLLHKTFLTYNLGWFW